MYVEDAGPAVTSRLRRENGVWGVMITTWEMDTNSWQKINEKSTEENGTFPIEEEIRMSEQTGSVGTSRGVTVNRGNYQSARIDVWASFPTKVEDVDANYKKCEEWVNERLKQEIEAMTPENCPLCNKK